jgi:hypothetical protein
LKLEIHHSATQETVIMNATADQPSSEQVDVQESNSVLLLTFWIFTLIISLILPFCWSKRQRTLCRQRLRERRWISDDGLDEDDWYYARYLRRQEERRQQEQERIQIAKNQQDEIREQYLLLLMRNYTMVRNIRSSVVLSCLGEIVSSCRKKDIDIRRYSHI